LKANTPMTANTADVMASIDQRRSDMAAAAGDPGWK